MTAIALSVMDSFAFYWRGILWEHDSIFRRSKEIFSPPRFPNRSASTYRTAL
jgi:hypothetical protein